MNTCEECGQQYHFDALSDKNTEILCHSCFEWEISQAGLNAFALGLVQGGNKYLFQIQAENKRRKELLQMRKVIRIPVEYKKDKPVQILMCYMR